MTAQQLLSARSDNDPAKSRLKGGLIGMELASARAAWQGKQVMIVNSSPWSSLYEQALSGQGFAVQTCDSDTMTLAGLKHAYRSLCETFA
jgi:2-dehydro-3-deoxygalactonokinase